MGAAAHRVASGTSRSSGLDKWLALLILGDLAPYPRLPRRQPADHRLSQEPSHSTPLCRCATGFDVGLGALARA